MGARCQPGGRGDGRRRGPARDARRARAREPARARGRGGPSRGSRVVEQREAARARRDWPEADRIRDELRSRGWEVRDGPDGLELLFPASDRLRAQPGARGATRPPVGHPDLGHQERAPRAVAAAVGGPADSGGRRRRSGVARSRTRTRACVRRSSRFATSTLRSSWAGGTQTDGGRSDPLIVALDQVQDPQNLGSICRTAECAGAAGVAIPERRAAEVTPAVCKASAGAVEHLPIARVRNLADFLADAKAAGVWCYGADRNGPIGYQSVDWGGPIVLVLGSEGRGLRPRVAARAPRCPRRATRAGEDRVVERRRGSRRPHLRRRRGRGARRHRLRDREVSRLDIGALLCQARAREITIN